MMRRLTQRFGRLIPSTVIALAVTAALVSIAGCGGGDSSATGGSSTQTASITKAELIKRGDAICRETDLIQTNAVTAYGEKHGEPGSPNELTQMLAKAGLPPIKDEIEQISALGAPKGDEAEVTNIIEGLEIALQETEEKPFALLRTDDGYFRKPDKLAARYGFKDCAQSL